MKTPEDIIREAEALRAKQNKPAIRKTANGYAAAMRIAIELAASLAVAGAMGWYIDAWLNTLPLFMVLCICLGFAAGMRTIKRVNDEIYKELQRENANADVKNSEKNE